ncbi:hypothetical protein OOK41_09210 [Micromonospora sp. NBC_01655]|uniref:hypothetical protein n=1 Tax=Micromonospora sp. NBC_01655 TaxID=2975983 RepID=UPI0022566A2E|nr:hypothetical protein [Micromonospora sp. NBC_01655]MCX4470484.1 hypothetical protein [Micromonospora sp. NBC_01655]
MNTSTLPRLPKPLTVGGATVAVRLPFGPNSVAHRPTWTRVNPESKYDLSATLAAACSPDDGECSALTAAWADHQGAQACTEDACFPDAEPR